MTSESGVLAAIDVHKVAVDAVRRIFARAEVEGHVVNLSHAVSEVEMAISSALNGARPEPREWR